MPETPREGCTGKPKPASGLAIEATAHVTHAKVLVWEGIKPGGQDPTGTYTKVAGCDPAGSFRIE